MCFELAMNTEAPGRHKCSRSFKLIPCGQKQFRYSPGFFSQKLNSLLISLSFWRYSCPSPNPSLQHLSQALTPALTPALVTATVLISSVGEIHTWRSLYPVLWRQRQWLSTQRHALQEEAHVHSSGHVYIYERAVSNAISDGGHVHTSHQPLTCSSNSNREQKVQFSVQYGWVYNGGGGGGLHCCHQSNKHSVFISSPVEAIQSTESITNKLWKLNL